MKLALACFAWGMVSCVQSSSPNVTELVQTEQPSIMGSHDSSLTSSSSIFNVSGTCDKKSFGTEYSINGGASWLDLGACTTGVFNFTVIVYSSLNVEVRSRTKFAFTPTSIARIRVIIPPTANLLTFVSASNSAFSSLTEPRLSYSMPSFSTGARAPGTQTFNMDHHTVGIVYAP